MKGKDKTDKPVSKPFTFERLMKLATRAGDTADPEFHGLIFSVEPRSQGAVSEPIWKVRFSIHGRPFLRVIGYWPDVTLFEARGRAELARRLITEFVEVDGPFARYTDGVRGPKTIRGLWDEYVETSARPADSQQRQNRDDRSRALRYIMPFVGDNTPDGVTADDIAEVINYAYQRLSETTVLKLKHDINCFFLWCLARGYIDWSRPLPTERTLLKPLLKRTQNRIPRQPHPALAERDVPRFVAILAKPENIWKPGALPLLFTLLTASRVGNVVGSKDRPVNQGAVWQDFDRNCMLWTIPAEKMKTGRTGGPHIVPMSNEARRILFLAKVWQGVTQSSGYVFTGARGKPIGYQALTKLLAQICESDRKGFVDPDSKERIHIHGFRATFKTWGTNHAVDSTLTEICLHHQIDKLRYDRAKAIQRRRKVMQDWATFCFSKVPANWTELALSGVSGKGKTAAGVLEKNDLKLLVCDMDLQL